MTSKTLKIELGSGIGAFQFGLTRESLEKAVGPADEIEENAEEDDVLGSIEVWHYDSYNLSVEFIEGNEWRLSTIAVNNDDCSLGGIKLLGKSLPEIENVLETLKLGEYDIQTIDMAEENEIEMISVFEAGLDLWFENKLLTEIQLTPVQEEYEAE